MLPSPKVESVSIAERPKRFGGAGLRSLCSAKKGRSLILSDASLEIPSSISKRQRPGECSVGYSSSQEHHQVVAIVDITLSNGDESPIKVKLEPVAERSAQPQLQSPPVIILEANPPRAPPSPPTCTAEIRADAADARPEATTKSLLRPAESLGSAPASPLIQEDERPPQVNPPPSLPQQNPRRKTAQPKRRRRRGPTSSRSGAKTRLTSSAWPTLR